MKEELGDIDKVVSIEVDSKMWAYMETRASLLQKAYETTVEVCSRLSQNPSFSPVVQYSSFMTL